MHVIPGSLDHTKLEVALSRVLTDFPLVGGRLHRGTTWQVQFCFRQIEDRYDAEQSLRSNLTTKVLTLFMDTWTSLLSWTQLFRVPSIPQLTSTLLRSSLQSLAISIHAMLCSASGLPHSATLHAPLLVYPCGMELVWYISRVQIPYPCLSQVTAPTSYASCAGCLSITKTFRLSTRPLPSVITHLKKLI
jgi:hypothetical protein